MDISAMIRAMTAEWRPSDRQPVANKATLQLSTSAASGFAISVRQSGGGRNEGKRAYSTKVNAAPCDLSRINRAPLTGGGARPAGDVP